MIPEPQKMFHMFWKELHNEHANSLAFMHQNTSFLVLHAFWYEKHRYYQQSKAET